MSGLKLDETDQERDNQISLFFTENRYIQDELPDHESKSRASIADAIMAQDPEAAAMAYQVHLKHIRDTTISVKMNSSK